MISVELDYFVLLATFPKLLLVIESYLSALLNEMDGLRQELESRDTPDSVWVKRLLVQLQDKLIATQELADEKLNSVQSILDLIEQKQQQLDQSSRNLGNNILFLYIKLPICVFIQFDIKYLSNIIINYCILKAS